MWLNDVLHITKENKVNKQNMSVFCHITANKTVVCFVWVGLLGAVFWNPSPLLCVIRGGRSASWSSWTPANDWRFSRPYSTRGCWGRPPASRTWTAPRGSCRNSTPGANSRSAHRSSGLTVSWERRSGSPWPMGILKPGLAEATY